MILPHRKDMMDNLKMTTERVRELTPTLTVLNMKVNGKIICEMV